MNGNEWESKPKPKLKSGFGNEHYTGSRVAAGFRERREQLKTNIGKVDEAGRGVREMRDARCEMRDMRNGRKEQKPKVLKSQLRHYATIYVACRWI